MCMPKVPYKVEINNISRDDWSNVLMQFNDANIYQTWSYGAIRWGENNLSHLLLKDEKEIVGAAQVRILKMPFMQRGIAYIRWGGMWQRKNTDLNPTIFRQLLRALQEEYAIKRGHFLRVLPNIMDIEAEKYLAILGDEGYRLRDDTKGERTLFIDLRSSLKELRENLKRRWRYYLKQAEKNDFSLVDASDYKLYDIFVEIYRQMHRRKRFVEYVDINEYRMIQQDLPDAFKMKIMACQLRDEVHAVVICAALGNTGIYVLGATSDKGLKSFGSYWLQWKMLEWLKTQGYHWYDLGGIDPVRVPGTARFKYGLAGKKHIDCKRVGQFDFCNRRSTNFAVAMAELVRLKYRKLKHNLNRYYIHA